MRTSIDVELVFGCGSLLAPPAIVFKALGQPTPNTLSDQGNSRTYLFLNTYHTRSSEVLIPQQLIRIMTGHDDDFKTCVFEPQVPRWTCHPGLSLYTRYDTDFIYSRCDPVRC